MHPWQPTIVLLQAGDLNTGAYCPFTELVRIARAWRLDPYIRRIWLVSGSEIQTPAPAARGRAGRLLDLQQPQVVQAAVRLRLCVDHERLFA